MEVKSFLVFSCCVVICASAYTAPPKSQCGQNEELSCVHECPPEKTCKTRGIEFDCITPTKKCEEKCVCKLGYNRNAIGECSTDEECDKTCEGPNEEYLECKESCPPEVCFSIVAFYDCSTEPPCKPGCACKPGHYRKEWHSDCVPSCECPQMYYADHCEKRRNAMKNQTET